MGRRKRRNSDIDTSLEELHSRRTDKRPNRNQQAVDEEPKERTKDETPEVVSRKSTNIQTRESKVDDDKIDEALRRKKQQRKERKKARQAQKKQQAESLRKKPAQQTEQQRESSAKEGQRKTKDSAGSQKFITTHKGVQYQDIVVGKGPIVQDRKKIRVAYTLRAKHRYGKILDSSDDFGFRLGRGEVIQGWDIGVQGMRQGGKRYLIVPPHAGYGNKNIGAGRGAILFFEVSILAC